ncbi:fructosamine kinase family protein [Nigerium massiliense]|uniref:fructosamine kinase family protein n=1 Tax=Nigerium massiliense TaxID=1522317 RepID=UPI000590AF34|nr:fructosamine kinase family protein [Nigerium massiliense]
METITKNRAHAPSGFFEVEAAGLEWLAEPEAVRVAKVVDVGPDHLEIERLDSASPSGKAARTFGAGLARLHDAGASAFGVGPDGWNSDGYIGEAPLSLDPEDAWGHFYAHQRCLPYAEQARAQGALSTAEFDVIVALAARLDDGDFDDEAPPARIHGDLWSGNVLWTPTGVGLIDPAAHGGHRVTDLAMLALFGTPHLGDILDGYAATSTYLPDDWREVIDLHQVHPLLVHAVLFGGGYGSQAAAAARRYL